MHRWITVLLGVGVLALCVGCSDQKEEDVAQELANRLTDALEFDNSEKVPELPPPEHPRNDAYPQATLKSAPADFIPEEGFTIVLETDYPDAASLTGSVAWVTDATEHIQITESYNEATGEMTLTGTFSPNPGLPEAVYVVALALRDDRGDIGNFVRWALRAPGKCTSIEQDNQRCDNDSLDPYIFICNNQAWEHHHCQDACDQQQPGSTAVGCEWSAEDGMDVCTCVF